MSSNSFRLGVGLSVLLAVSGGGASAALIDGSTNNGGFETGTGTAYTNVPGWENETGANGVNARNTNRANTGSYSGIIGGSSIPASNTGHNIALGEVFQLSFFHTGASGWIGNVHTYDWRLYYTSDDTVAGTQTVLETGTVTPIGNTNATWQSTGTLTSAAVTDAGAVGKDLWLGFESNQGTGIFGRVDDVVLTVVPEPGSLALLGLGGLLIARRRR